MTRRTNEPAARRPGAGARPVATAMSRCYAALLYAYPRAFRARYRDELVATFEAGLAERHGTLARARFALAASTGALRHGIAERAARPWPGAGIGLDVRMGWRSLVRRPGFVLAAALPVALGVGGVTAVFAVMDGVLLRPLPYEQPDELVKVGRPLSNGVLAPVSNANFIDIEKAVPGLQLAALMGGQMVTRGSDSPELLSVARPSRAFMGMFRVQPALGRSFLADEFEDPRVALLTWAYWQRAFGGDPRVLGETLATDKGSFRIIGVLPRTWQAPEALYGADAEVWIPFDYADEMLERTRAFGFTTLVGRLRAGATVETVNEQLRAAALSLHEQHTDANSERDGSPKMLEARSLHGETVGAVRGYIGMLFGAVALLLVIACANVANLFLARGSEREREIAMRTALGAGRVRLLMQLLVESLAVGLIGGIAGVALAYASIDVLVAWTPELPRAGAVAVDLRVVAVACFISLLSGLAFGILPALTVSQRDPGAVLRGGSQPARRNDLLRGALVVGQTALALALVVGGGLLVNSVARLAMVDLGFRTDNVLTVRPRLTQYISSGSDEAATPFYRAFREQLTAIPGVGDVSAAMFLPGEGLPVAVTIDDPGGGEPLERYRNTVMPGYFDILDIDIMEGRAFGPQDGEGAARVAVLSRSLARQLFPDQAAIGRTLTANDGMAEQTFTVIGVAEDVRNEGAHGEPEPVFYESFVQNPWLASMAMLLEYEGDPAAIMQPLRAALRRADPTVPLGSVVSMADIVAGNTMQERHYALLLSTFSLIALAIAAVGLYATISYMVTRRLRELAIRVAVGARGADVIKLVLRRGMAQAALGIVLGCALAVTVTGVLESLLFGITPTDPVTLLAAAAVLGVVALIASVIPAARATRVDPLAIMRAG